MLLSPPSVSEVKVNTLGRTVANVLACEELEHGDGRRARRSADALLDVYAHSCDEDFTQRVDDTSGALLVPLCAPSVSVSRRST